MNSGSEQPVRPKIPALVSARLTFLEDLDLKWFGWVWSFSITHRTAVVGARTQCAQQIHFSPQLDVISRLTYRLQYPKSLGRWVVSNMHKQVEGVREIARFNAVGCKRPAPGLFQVSPAYTVENAKLSGEIGCGYRTRLRRRVAKPCYGGTD